MKRRAPNFSRAFTLVEMIVSIVVLTLLVIMVAQLTSSVTNIVTSNREHLDADNQARLVFDRMANDFDRMARRGDMDCLFSKLDGSGQNDAMYFFSEAPASFDAGVTTNQSSATLVGYRINFNNASYPNSPVLERLGKGLTWDGATSSGVPGGMVFLTTASGTATPQTGSTIAGNWTGLGNPAGANNSAYGDGTDPDYFVLSDQVYRLEIEFLLTDGSISPNPILSTTPANWNASAGAFYTQAGSDPTVASGSSTYGVGSRWFNTTTKQGFICTNATAGAAVWNRIGVQDLSAIIVGIAILDDSSRKLIPSASAYTSMVNALGDAVAGTPILQTWNGTSYTTPAPFLKNSGIPKNAASQIRIYQRYFYLNTNS
jgi:type II secretory pathway pseudopilin PulG